MRNNGPKPRDKNHFLKFWFPVIIYAILIFWGSSLEGPFEAGVEIYGFDKMLHTLEYAALGILLARAINASMPDISCGRVIFIAFIIGAFYGLTDEFHQYFTPGRSASPADLTADAVGGFLGALAFAARLKKARVSEKKMRRQ